MRIRIDVVCNDVHQHVIYVYMHRQAACSTKILKFADLEGVGVAPPSCWSTYEKKLPLLELQPRILEEKLVTRGCTPFKMSRFACA